MQHAKDGYDVVSVNIMLARAETVLDWQRYRLKKEGCSSGTGNDAFIVIDMPPSLGVLTVTVFTYTNDILILATAGPPAE